MEAIDISLLLASDGNAESRVSRLRSFDLHGDGVYRVRTRAGFGMRVLMVSCDLRISTPAGAVYVAGAARDAGHAVEIFDGYLADDLRGQLADKLIDFEPDVLGVSITAVTSDVLDSESPFGTKYVDMRPAIKSIVDVTREHSRARIVPGGCGFNYYAEDWLAYLDLDYGIRGEGEHAFPHFLDRLQRGRDPHGIPGSVWRRGGRFHKAPRDRIEELDGTALPAYDLIDADAYRAEGLPFSVFTKRGCAFGCTFCPHSSLEGKRYRLKSPERVVNEIQRVVRTTGSLNVNYCDNSFNVPRRHAEAVCRQIIDDGVEVRWRSGAIKPVKMTEDFCSLMKDSGCEYAGLSIESASEKMLAGMQRGYGADDVRKALDCLGESGIPFGLSILLGAPGETPETIRETFDVVDRYSMVEGVWVNIGIYLWTHHQKVLEAARGAGQLRDDRELFDGAYYISPELPEGYMTDLISSLRAREGFFVQVNKPYASYEKPVNPARSAG
jgi:radical SAM superfamily enzyme YgiQ (UPF0313 family)